MHHYSGLRRRSVIFSVNILSNSFTITNYFTTTASVAIELAIVHFYRVCIIGPEPATTQSEWSRTLADHVGICACYSWLMQWTLWLQVSCRTLPSFVCSTSYRQTRRLWLKQLSHLMALWRASVWSHLTSPCLLHLLFQSSVLVNRRVVAADSASIHSASVTQVEKCVCRLSKMWRQYLSHKLNHYCVIVIMFGRNIVQLARHCYPVTNSSETKPGTDRRTA